LKRPAHEKRVGCEARAIKDSITNRLSAVEVRIIFEFDAGEPATATEFGGTESHWPGENCPIEASIANELVILPCPALRRAWSPAWTQGQLDGAARG
jgi:hypothetical protein